MIVISSALVLDPVETGPDHPLIGSDNIVTASNIAATTAALNFPASNLGNPMTHTQARWIAADTTQQYLTITTDGFTAFNYIAVARHNFGSALIRPSIEVNIAGVWTEISPPVYVPADNGPLLWRFDSQVRTQARIRLQSGTVPARAGVVYLGKLTVVQRRLYVGHVPMPYARKSDFSNGMSETGDFLGRIELGSYTETTASFRLITPSWFRATMAPCLAVIRKKPFFFAWRPASYPNEVGYGVLAADTAPAPQDQGSGNLIAFDLMMRGVA
jgi:hypothetical protein